MKTNNTYTFDYNRDIFNRCVKQTKSITIEQKIDCMLIIYTNTIRYNYKLSASAKLSEERVLLFVDQTLLLVLPHN